MNKQTWILKNRQKGNTSGVVASDVHKLVDENSESSVNYIEGTNHVLLILDGTPIEKGLKVRNFFDTLPNDNSPFSIMTLGGRIDFMPDVSLRPQTTFGSVDKLNPLIVTDHFFASDGIVEIGFINMKFDGRLEATTNIINSTFDNVNASIKANVDIMVNVFKDVTSNAIAADTGNMNGNVFKDVNTNNITVALKFGNNKFLGGKGDFLITTDDISNTIINMEMTGYASLTDSRLRNCFKIDDDFNILNQN